ncbi:MAG: sulfotransferase, partial [Gammaproteobacteria bacterium]|nr:sulfotransferase [Gammaproteobacteria bacterium]
ADCLDAADRIDEAFACYERANRMAVDRARAEGLLYDPAATTRQTEELISIFPAVPATATKHSEPRPIFILGMPRSGTTLVESVLGAHSRVAAGGEKAGIRQILPEFLAFARSGRVADISESQWAQWRAFYLQEARVPAGIAAMTDKNPWNFDALGLILGLFPDARIVHIRRNPVETGFSIFRHEFSKLIRFANRLEDIGHFYGEYARVMAHWERVAADRFVTIQYEDFVRQFNVAAPALLAACGLDWEDTCGQFWKSKRAVSTISSMQVRRAPGKPATRAQAYVAQLQPLAAALRLAHVDLVTGRALAESG